MKKTLLLLLAIFALAACQPQPCRQGNKNAAQDSTESPLQHPQGGGKGVAAEGQPAPEFTLPGPDGIPVSLNELRGQYVVLDFWGTWCKWCIKGIPDMKHYYEKYQGKFEILSIDVGDDEESWRQAIESYDMEWLHVITDEESAQLLQGLYKIEGYPTKIVVDPEGRIIKIVVGEDPAFYEFLDELFGGK